MAVTKIAAGTVPRHGRFAKRARAKRRPQSRLQQLRLHHVVAEGGKIGGVKTRKFAFLIAFNLNNNRLQDATLTTMDGDNGAAGWGCKHNARIFFILEECLAFYYAIAFLYQPSRDACPRNHHLQWRHDEYWRRW